MARGWDVDSSERCWVEIRKLDGIGAELTCPTTQVGGDKDPWYELVASVKAGDVIYRWSAREHRFVGRSLAAKDAVEDHAQHTYRVEPTGFANIVADVSEWPVSPERQGNGATQPQIRGRVCPSGASGRR